jgi:AAA+ superfamily predicted ATPase
MKLALAVVLAIACKRPLEHTAPPRAAELAIDAAPIDAPLVADAATNAPPPGPVTTTRGCRRVSLQSRLEGRSRYVSRAMIREYATAREYMEDVIRHVDRMLQQHGAIVSTDDEAAQRRAAELTLELEREDELMRARCESSAALGIELPLERLRRAFALTPTEQQVLEILIALEVSAQVRASAKPYLDQTGSATIELLEGLVYRHRRSHASTIEELGVDSRLFALQLAHSGSGDLPWLARPVKIAPRVLELALGRLRLDPQVAKVASLVSEPANGDVLLLDINVRAVVETAIKGQLERSGAPLPFVVGADGSGRGSVVHAAAHSLGRPVLDVRGSQLPRDPVELASLVTAMLRETVLFGAVLLIRELDALVGNLERGVADRVAVVVAGVVHAGVPVAFTALENVWPQAATHSMILVELEIPNELERETLWRRALPGAETVIERAAERYRVTAGVIERAANFARVQASARLAPVELDDVRSGIRLQLDRDLSTLGRRIEWKQSWDDVVLADEVRAELDEMMSRVRHRRRVLDEWGFGRKVAKGTGVSALFSGPPGTGKTMVANLIAKELEVDLYMIDASRLVSKWIGETEKNLARLFDAAGAGHAALLFDEADSLFAKRTEVKSSTDRYANLEVNYLLQRMEAFEGVTILTTNLESSIDDAFKRRLAFRIAFSMPEIAERARLWQAMLPAQAAVADDIDFELLANKFVMSGGYIRNAVLRAAYLAAAEQSHITMRHLQRGAMLEYTAMGKVIHQGSAL